MPSLRSAVVNTILARRFKPRLAAVRLDAESIRATRAGMNRWGAGVAPGRGLTREAAHLAGIPVEWTRVAAPRGVIYYCHGGGYIVGSPIAYRRFANRLARSSGCDVAVIDYRLAPEHPFPAAPDDALAGYRALLAAGHAAADIVIGGDSAGGNLALVTLLRVKAEGLPLPARAFLLSPWADLAATGASIEENAAADPMLPAARIADAASLYAGVTPRDHPLVSPLYGDYAGLPPLLLLAGSTEILRDDAVRVAERARAAGVAATLKIWPRMPHVFPVLADVLPEGRRALYHIAEFIRQLPGARAGSR
jgi:monoterpene epsilon-lactone hydrolase